MMCLLVFRDIEVLLYYSTHQFQIQLLLMIISFILQFSGTNLSKSRNYKINRYKNLSNKVVGNYAVKKLFLEILSIESYTNDTKPFIKFLGELKIDNTLLRKCSEVAIRASFYLYIRKNKEWLSPKLLTFVQV